jgi:hypothetical protein
MSFFFLLFHHFTRHVYGDPRDPTPTNLEPSKYATQEKEDNSSDNPEFNSSGNPEFNPRDSLVPQENPNQLGEGWVKWFLKHVITHGLAHHTWELCTMAWQQAQGFEQRGIGW